MEVVWEVVWVRPTLLALLRLWEEELGRRWQRVTGHQHQLLELQQLLNVLEGTKKKKKEKGSSEQIVSDPGRGAPAANF